MGAGQSRGELSSAVPGDLAAESANFSEITGGWVCACSPRWSSAAWLTSKPWLDQGKPAGQQGGLGVSYTSFSPGALLSILVDSTAGPATKDF